jgi:putative DNA methylase
VEVLEQSWEARGDTERLCTVCERKKWAQEAIAYNALVVSWPEVQKLAGRGAAPAGGGNDGLFA